MGYKLKPKTFVLDFEGTDYEGLEINAKSLPMGEFLQVSARFSKTQQTDEDVEAVMQTFANSIVSWNLEDENDQPVPPNLDGLKTLDLDFVLAVIAAWVNGISAPGRSLGKASTSGESSLEDSIPMEAL